MPLSHKPPLVGSSIAKTHLSAELIRKSEEFIVNVPDFDLLDKVKLIYHPGGKFFTTSDKKIEGRI